MEKEQVLALTNGICKNTLMETLGIEYTDVGEDFLQARMPVTPKVHQPDGVLHGGASDAFYPRGPSLAMQITASDNPSRGGGLSVRSLPRRPGR